MQIKTRLRFKLIFQTQQCFLTINQDFSYIYINGIRINTHTIPMFPDSSKWVT